MTEREREVIEAALAAGDLYEKYANLERLTTAIHMLRLEREWPSIRHLHWEIARPVRALTEKMEDH